MPEQITQKLGFDASNTFTVLSQLEAGFARFATSLSTATDRINSLSSAGNTLPRKLDETSKAVKGLTISWQTLGRVVVTQFIVRAMSTMRDAFKDAYTSALEFSKQVSEIRAISPDRSFAQIADDVRRLSDAFNQPLSTTAEAQYQVISDQFTTAAERADILTAANMLAKVGADDLTASAQLLTGALNAYGESSDRASVRAAQFFESVNLGRFRMGELGTALGRVQAIGYQVGLSLEELQAALVTVTIGGVKSNEAATQLRGVMTALIKPSEDMKKVLRELGVESGQAAIATWGFQGTLQKLMEYAGGSVERVGELFRNVRGLAGVLRIAGEGADAYNEALTRLTSTQLTLNEKFKEFMDTDAEKLTKELNKIQNYFTAEFGKSIVEAFQKVSVGSDAFIGIVRSLVSSLPYLIGYLTAASAVMLKFGGSAKYAAVQLKDLGSVRNIAGIAVLMETGWALGGRIGEWISKSLSESYAAARETQTKMLALAKEEATTAIMEGERKTHSLMQNLRQYLVEANKVYLRDADNLKTALTIEEKVNKAAFARIMQSRQSMTQQLFAISENAATQAATDIPKAIAEIEQRIEDRQFAKRISTRSLSGQWDAIRQQYNAEMNRAMSLQSTAKTSDQEALAKTAWDRVEAFRKQGEEIAKQTGSASQLEDSEKRLNEIDEARVRSLKEQQRMQEQLAKDAEARAIKAEQHNIELDELRKKIEEKMRVTTRDSQGVVGFKGREQLQRDLKDSEGLIEEFVAKTRKYKGDFATPFLGDERAFEELRRKAETSLASANLKHIEMAPEAIASLYRQIEEKANNLRLHASVIVDIERFTGKSVLTDGLNSVFDEAEARLKELTARAIKAPILGLSISEELNQFDKAMKIARAKTPKLSEAGGPQSFTETMGMEDVFIKMQRLRQDTDITEKEIAALQTAIDSVDWTVIAPGPRTVVGEQVKTMMQSLKELAELQAQLRENKPLTVEEEQSKRTIEDQLRGLKKEQELRQGIIDGKKWDLETGKAITVGINDQTTAVQRTKDAVGQLAAQWFTVGTRIGEVASKISGLQSGQTMAAASGGKAWDYLAAGGRPRGTDVQPAWLTRGERVINEEASRKFASQLVAMNAGVKPVFRSEGGTVTNVGDINVTVSGGGSSHQTARSIAVALRRELRRGTSTL